MLVMERSEPTLVPEWLKGTGNVTGGGGSTNHHFASSSSHADESGVALPTRNRSSLNIADYDSSHSSALDRTSLSYFRRSSSSNGSMGHDKDGSAHSRSYSSFGRSYRDREWDKDILNFREKDRSGLGGKRDRDFSNADVFTSRIEKDMFRRSQSMITAKRGDMQPRRAAADANSVSSHSNHNGATAGNKTVNIHKATFERDFPSLGAEERQVVERVASPGLSIAAQSLPIGSSAMIMGNGWTSALAEVPSMAGSNSMGPSSVPQTAASSSGSLAPSTTSGLNMAETLAQAPSKARAAPQLSVETQRLEELAIKQSRQLIPMTPSMPKILVLGSDKQKPKNSTRNEMSMANKLGQQQVSSSQPITRSGTTTTRAVATAATDVAPKTSNGGNFLVLKSSRENGVSHTTTSPTNSTRTAVSSPLAVVSPIPAPIKPKQITTPLNKAPSSMEKKPMSSQAQSRNDFFNLMRKKSLSSGSNTDPVVSKAAELPAVVNSQPDPVVVTNGGEINGGEGEDKYLDASPLPDEEEAAFLRSLGWEEDGGGEEEGLTEEEINAFYQEYMKLKPTSKLCQKFSTGPSSSSSEA